MDILNVVGNIFLEQSEFWWLAFLFLLGWVWTVKVDNVDTYMAAYINDLQDCKVDTDEVPILQNILGGSLFGTWSQSDANKGLAIVKVDSGSIRPTPGETITGAKGTGKAMWMDNDAGNWGAGTGTGDIYLGAVTGTFIDNENLNGTDAGANFATVNGDKTIGVTNDPCDNDDTADWTQDGDALVFDVGGWYEWATSAVTKYCYKGSLAFTKGKIYKIEIEMRDGAAAPTDLQIYFYDGAEQVGPDIDTANPGGAFTKYTHTFECATTTAAGRAGIKAPTSLGGNEIDFQDFSCYEIAPCCTEADTKAWDGDEWTKESGLDLYREHWDGGTNTKNGSFYALKCVPDDINNFINWRYELRTEEEHKAKFYGRTAIMGIWAKTSTANHFRMGIYEGGPGTSVYSEYHPGDGDWHWLEVPITYLTNSGYIYNQWRFYQPDNIDGSTIVYLSQPMLIFCNATDGIIGEGNYIPKQQEVIYTKNDIASQAIAGSSLGDVNWTDVNIEADTDAMFPKGCKAIYILTANRDSGSGGADAYVALRSNPNFANGQFINSLYGIANDCMVKKNGIQPCDENGDMQYKVEATGGNTFDFGFGGNAHYYGVQVT